METSSKTTDGTSGDKGPPNQPDERTLREERLLDAAATLLVRWGYRRTSIDDVAREAGVGGNASGSTIISGDQNTVRQERERH